MTYIYLASPYSHADKGMMQARYDMARAAAARLMERGRSIFCPVAHSHPIADFLAPEARLDFDLWMRQDLPILRYASELWVLTIDGWMLSRGVARERNFARTVGIPERFLHPETLDFMAMAEENV